MLSLNEARAAIAQATRATNETEDVALIDARGRYLAQDIAARIDHPPFDNSAMDGYALNAEELGDQRLIPVNGVASCGSRPATLVHGSAMRIFTGAPIPAGANTIVIQEDVQLEGTQIALPSTLARGEHVRRRGGDFRHGAPLYRSGQRLRSVDLAVLAAAGWSQVRVYRRPRVLVIATGDELIAPPHPLEPGQIYESNRIATMALLQEVGAVAIDGGMVPDSLAALKTVLAQAGDYDFVITSGGASVGDRDLVRQAFADRGEFQFWKVRIKPGKPIAFGHYGNKTHFFALPGNPVSSLVTFKLFVEPALVAWNHGVFAEHVLPARAAHDFVRTAGRMEFLRAYLYLEEGELLARALSNQGSHMIGALRETNGFIRLAEAVSQFARGDRLDVIPLICH